MVVATRRMAANQEGSGATKPPPEEVKSRKLSPAKRRTSRSSSLPTAGDPAVALTSPKAGAPGSHVAGTPLPNIAGEKLASPARRGRKPKSEMFSPVNAVGSPRPSTPAAAPVAPSGISPAGKALKSPAAKLGEKTPGPGRVASPAAATPKAARISSPGTKPAVPILVHASSPKSAKKEKKEPAAAAAPLPAATSGSEGGRSVLCAALVLLLAIGLGAGAALVDKDTLIVHMGWVGEPPWDPSRELPLASWLNTITAPTWLRMPTCCSHGGKGAAGQGSALQEKYCALSLEANKLMSLLAKSGDSEKWVDNFVEAISERAVDPSSVAEGAPVPSAAAVMLLAGSTQRDAARAAQVLASAFPGCQSTGCVHMLHGSEINAEFKKLYKNATRKPTEDGNGMSDAQRKKAQRGRATEEVRANVAGQLERFLSTCPSGVVIVEDLQDFPPQVASVLHNLMSEQGDYSGVAARGATVIVTVEMPALDEIAAMDDVSDRTNALKGQLLNHLENHHKLSEVGQALALSRRFHFANVIAPQS
eukprot:jgi/Mesvir1/10180/Mv05155-RA.1